MIPSGEQVHDFFKRPGQNWIDSSKRCYKCQHFQSNMPMTGKCEKQKTEYILSGDFCRGDYCQMFELKSEVINA